MATHVQSDASPLVVDPGRQAALAAAAASSNRSAADLLNDAIDGYLELSPDDWTAIEEGERDCAAGRVVPLAQLLDQLKAW